MVILIIMLKAETLKERNRSSMAHSKTRLVKLVEQSLKPRRDFTNMLAIGPGLTVLNPSRLSGITRSLRGSSMTLTEVVVREGLFSVRQCWSLIGAGGGLACLLGADLSERASSKRDSFSSLLSAFPSVWSISLVWPNTGM